MDKEELKQRCLNVIEEHRDEIIALGKEAYKTPELGFIQAAVCPPVPRETGPGWR